MSLDDTYQALVAFSRTLEEFDVNVRADRAELMRLHADIDGLWQDAFRKTYDLAMADLEEEFRTYTHSHSEQFETFMKVKIAQLRQYLNGG